jgi:hypothetical protein
MARALKEWDNCKGLVWRSETMNAKKSITSRGILMYWYIYVFGGLTCSYSSW